MNGVNIKEFTEKELREQIAFVPQNRMLFEGSIRDNLRFGNEHATDEEMIQALKQAEAWEFVSSLEEGLDAHVEQKGDNFSGGQKQRVGIARALAGNPSILLCDEATSALDPETTAEVLNLIKEIHSKTNITVVLITHEMNVIKTICTKVAVIDGGTIAEDGLVSEVFYHPTQEVTKKFLAQTSFASEFEERKNIEEWKKVFTEGVIIKFTFDNNTSKKPILSTLVREIDFDFTIINGHIDKTADANIGTLFVQLIGTKENTDKAISRLNELGILTEVL